MIIILYLRELLVRSRWDAPRLLLLVRSRPFVIYILFGRVLFLSYELNAPQPLHRSVILWNRERNSLRYYYDFYIPYSTSLRVLCSKYNNIIVFVLLVATSVLVDLLQHNLVSMDLIMSNLSLSIHLIRIHLASLRVQCTIRGMKFICIPVLFFA